MKRKEYGVFARDIGNVDIEDLQEPKAGKDEASKAAEASNAGKDKENGPVAGEQKGAAAEEKENGVAGKEEAAQEKERKVKAPAVKGQAAKEGKRIEAPATKRPITKRSREEIEEDLEVTQGELSYTEIEEEAEAAAPVKKRRGRLMLVVAVVLVVVLILLLYYVVIPRTELTLKVYYNESVLNQINVDSELRNGGTVAVDDLTLEISVVNSTDQQMGEHNYTVRTIAPFSGPERLEAITFRGSQYEDYTIIIDLQFNSGGRAYSGHWSHETEEPWMNQDFTETVSGF